MKQLKLGLEPGRAQNSLPTTEADIQRCIEQGLARLGYTVLHTQHAYSYQTCPNCGRKFRPNGGYGASKGIPDLLVGHGDWPAGTWLGLEVKGPKTPVSTEQQALLASGRLVIVRNWEEAIAAVRTFGGTIL